MPLTCPHHRFFSWWLFAGEADLRRSNIASNPCMSCRPVDTRFSHPTSPYLRDEACTTPLLKEPRCARRQHDWGIPYADSRIPLPSTTGTHVKTTRRLGSIEVAQLPHLRH